MKKTFYLLLAVSITLFALTSVAMAVTSATTVYKWSQPIDQIPGESQTVTVIGDDGTVTVTEYPVYNGWDQPSWGTSVPPVGAPQVADDWECKDNRPVTDIHWWGSYLDWMEPSSPTFKPGGFWFGMYTDVPVSPTNPYSHPGELKWEYATSAYREVLVGFDKDPRTGLITDSTFQYNVDLPTSNWFNQDPSANAIYWLSIVALYPTTPEFEWGWKTRPHFFQDDAVTLNATGGWDRVGYVDTTGNFQSWDTAFELSTVPEPSSLLAFATGFTSLVGLAIRRRRAA